ncbi:stage V sporulation protein AF [Lachnospiraceae bacterium KM106-2]|nr:stage V sporulation protein AF [Lachnospiraceae bacterium KM106-2]
MSVSLSSDLAINIKNMNEILNIDKNFDILYRVITIAGKEACLYFIDGLNKDEVLEKLMESFYKIKPEEMADNAHEFSKLMLPYGEVDLMTDMDQIITMLLAGVPMLVVDGFNKVLAIDFRTYPARGVEEPEKDKVLRGSKDGFVETVVFNTALIRRRIRNPDLIMEITSVGDSSHTDIVLCYMKNRVDNKFLGAIQEKLKNIRVDALTLNTESLAEELYRSNWFNPFPKYKYSERPDTAAASILEGSIVIIVDNSPSVMILPTTLFEITEEADDYYFPPLTGTYLRLSRMLINIAALFLTPVWLLLMLNPQLIPGSLAFIQIKDPINVPLLLQLLILEFAIDGLKLASLNTPSMLSTPLSVVAGIVLGDFTVSSGWFNAETMLYMAFVAIANYSQASFELGYALKFLRIIMLLLTGFFGIWGFVIGVGITIFSVVTNKTLSGQSYLYPLIPFNGKELLRRLFRVSLSTADKQK